ncbi:hypothetical protein OTB20_22355 [Streptomyces sp. H27-H1]|uniref:hypothetical protein n=1 Tax=Streptomyces sp. H27-H1 TaxID=2996461 RepID=UPI00226EECC2|nr:hypothetical protein [Streptomyces sp. H27-H1]MCY0928903.1 hypothetical protein [Streptomyces sp. H27-H1]
MSTRGEARETVRPIPRDRPDQQAEAAEVDPLDIETMVEHARREREEPKGAKPRP